MSRDSVNLPIKKRKNRLIVVLSLILTSGFLMTSLASYVVSSTSLRTEILNNELPLTSDNIYSEIQRDLLQPIFISSLMASDTFLRDWVIEGEIDEGKIVRYLDEIKTRYDTLTSFFVSEKTRQYYYSKGVLKTVSDGEKRDAWYFRVRKMFTDYEINVDPDMANSDAMTIFINYRVYDYDGQYIGAAGVGLAVTAVKSLIESYQKDYERIIYFVDHNGDIVLHGSGFPDEQECLGDIEGLASRTAEILSNSQSSIRYKKSGGSYLLNTRYISEFNWYLLVEQSESKVLRQILYTLIINLIICAIITTAILYLTHMTLSRYQKKLEAMATLDKLTEIYNRQAFSILFKELIKEVHRRFIPFSMVMMDIDHFKRVNDTYGHLIGDMVLRELVDIVRHQLRGSDLLCRWGGEEFVILLKECKLDDAFRMAEKIRLAVAAHPIAAGDEKINVTISLGVAQWNLLDDKDENTIVARADQALYQAKDEGRNRCVLIR